MASKDEVLRRLGRGLSALELSMNFFEDRRNIGLGAAVERLRIGLKTSNIWRGEQDEGLLNALLNGELSDEEIHSALNSSDRRGSSEA